MKLKDEALIKSIHDFFQIYLPRQKCYSQNTVSSYKYAFNLFLDYMEDERGLPLFKLTVDDINADNINGFLAWLAEKRLNSPATCNQRLMALRSFAKYLGLGDFSLSAVYARVRAVPTKKKEIKVVEFLSKQALKELLKQPDTKKPKGLRDQFFMVLMYDTAARCQELLDIKIKDLSISGGAPFVYLTGKGNKTRTVPLMVATVNHLRNYLSVFHPGYQEHGDDFLFYVVTHRQRHQMSADTVATFMKKYGESAALEFPDMPGRIHPHQIRHTRAIHLYRDGMPLALLSEFLGHASIETTKNYYAYADTEMKRNAIKKAAPTTAYEDEAPIWNDSDRETLRRLAGL